MKMSGEKTASPCNKFQANIFNKSKCQNCFKARELHLVTDHDMAQAKPIYGGWLCLAPEGTDFDNPVQRSRKWQRRFFILYEDGSLSFALDELSSTLPQGTVNMNLCTEVVDAEPRTGQRNSLCIITPAHKLFIRGENKEIINGWSEQLAVYPRTKKLNSNKKRKVEPVASQEPSPAKMAATDPCFSTMESAAGSGSSLWQEGQPSRGPDVAPVWTVTDTHPLGPEQPHADVSKNLCPVSSESLALNGSWPSSSVSCPVRSLDSVASGDTYPGGDRQPVEPQPNDMQTSTSNTTQRADRSSPDFGQEGDHAISRKGRSELRPSQREKLQSCGDIQVQLTAPPPQRRAKSLDRRTSESVMTPDLLNFKKGWMVKLEKEDRWKKYWFVLSTDSLRYYKDSLAEEATDLEGEIDLTTCFNVSECQVQRNYGFQIHTQKGVFTLSAMTAGIRRNWIQALMKNVHPSNAPDVASLPGHHIACSLQEALPKPDVTQDSSSETPTDREQQPRPRSALNRRREGRYKTFDWAEFRLLTKPAAEPGAQMINDLCPFELVDLARRKRREERRKRYESMLGVSLGVEVGGASGDLGEDSVRALSPRSQQKVQEEIEQCWLQVEKCVFRPDKTVLLYVEAPANEPVEIEKLLDSYRKGVDDLKAQLAEADQHRQELETQLRTAECSQQVHPQLELALSSEVDALPQSPDEASFISHTQCLRDMYRETQELLHQQNMIRQNMQEELSLGLSTIPTNQEQDSSGIQTPTIWLHDTDGNLRELDDLISDSPMTTSTSSLSPVSDSQHSLLQTEEESRELSFDSKANPYQTQLEGHVHDQVSSSETLIMEGTVLKNTANSELNCCETPSCVEDYMVPDQVLMRRLSQEVEFLTSQNEALNQRNQEMLNQLTEADREIDRLKAELTNSHSEPCLIPEAEQLSQTRVECLERELSKRNQELVEAQSLVNTLERELVEAQSLVNTLETELVEAQSLVNTLERELVEAQSLVNTLETSLRDTEKQLRLKEATLQGLVVSAKSEEPVEEKNCTVELHCGNEAEGYLVQCFEATEAKLIVLQRQLQQSELTCMELQAHNAELSQVERLYSQRAKEAEADIKRLNEDLQTEQVKQSKALVGRVTAVSGEERTQQMIASMVLRLKALGKLLELIDWSNLNVIKRSVDGKHKGERQSLVVNQLMWEEAFWEALLSRLKANPSQLSEERDMDMLLREAAERMVAEKQMLLLARDLFSETDVEVGCLESRPLKELDIVENIVSVTVSENKEEDDNRGILDWNYQHHDINKNISENFVEMTQMKVALLNYIATSVKVPANDKLRVLAHRLYDFHNSEHPWVDLIHSAATEAFLSCEISRLYSACRKQLVEAKHGPLSSSVMCGNCAMLMKENEELQARLSNLDGWQSPSGGGEMATKHVETTDLQDTDTELQNSAEELRAETTDTSGKEDEEDTEVGDITEENVHKHPTTEEIPKGEDLPNSLGITHLSERGIQDEISPEKPETVDAAHNESESFASEEVVLLRGRVDALEEQLLVITEEMETEFQGRMASLQSQHMKDMERLKATCDYGLTTMEASHQRVLEDLHHRHQLEVERLLKDKDRLLDEETAATATAIEAIKNAHRMELEKEVQRMCQSRKGTGDIDVEELCRQHGEELTSCQRELEVLSQQFSLKCLENGHLAQALEAERKALCQCQQENQDLRTRNQEMSGHLAAEITRLWSVAKQDALPLSQGMDAYELEITLRVKESEVQCLKQEIISLKDELQSTLRDKRAATKKYKDIYMEMSILRAKAERDIEQLRENLQLAHKALGDILS